MKALAGFLVGLSLCFSGGPAQEANKATETQQLKSIPAGAKVFINIAAGALLATALKDQQVPVEVVADKDKAEFLIVTGRIIIQKGSVFEGTWEMTHIPTGTVMLKCRVSNVGNQKKFAESCAKQIKKKTSGK
jgi:hypothetical protein